MSTPDRVRLVHLTTVPETLEFLAGQVSEMRRRGFDVAAMSSPGGALDSFGQRERISTYAVEMPRRVTPLNDLSAVAQITRHLRRIRPQIVHAHTPKGGLLGMIAARLAQVPVRIYNIHGLPYMTATGSRRTLLRSTERTACALANRVLCVSHSIRDVAVADGLCAAEKIAVLRGGTINGVDATSRFNPARQAQGRSTSRTLYGIPADALVLGFVGRLVRDKGIVELTQAWQALRDERRELHMLIVGPFESHDPLPANVAKVLLEDPRIHMTGMVQDTAPLYAAMDLLALPTYREGFPTVVLEAGAMALPVVTSRVPGCLDAVQEGITGTMVAPRDARALASSIRMYVDDAGLRRRHATAGRDRVLRDFRPQDMWEAMHGEYVRLLTRKSLPLPLNRQRQVQTD